MGESGGWWGQRNSCSLCAAPQVSDACRVIELYARLMNDHPILETNTEPKYEKEEYWYTIALTQASCVVKDHSLGVQRI